MKKVSVIVPVYNTEKYLHRCIESILDQTYKMLELILIDDGSTDSSGIICDEVAQKDTRVKVLHKKNEGAGEARNCGINIAQGEYICFVDSDDYISSRYIEIMLHAAEKYDCGIVQCDFLFGNEENYSFIEEENLTTLLCLLYEVPGQVLLHAQLHFLSHKSHNICPAILFLPLL